MANCIVLIMHNSRYCKCENVKNPACLSMVSIVPKKLLENKYKKQKYYPVFVVQIDHNLCL